MTQSRPFVSPGRVLAGAGAIRHVAAELDALSVQPADGAILLVADAAVLDLGLADEAIGALHAGGFEVDVRPGVGGEPTPDAIAALAPTGALAIGAIVALGGGRAPGAAEPAAGPPGNDPA